MSILFRLLKGKKKTTTHLHQLYIVLKQVGSFHIYQHANVYQMEPKIHDQKKNGTKNSHLLSLRAKKTDDSIEVGSGTTELAGKINCLICFRHLLDFSEKKK